MIEGQCREHLLNYNNPSLFTRKYESPDLPINKTSTRDISKLTNVEAARYCIKCGRTESIV